MPPAQFDPTRNPSEDLESAIALARATDRRIVLDVGGEWCVWCHILDGFIDDHEDLRVAVDRDFVWLKVNVSPESENTEFLAAYPPVPGYPHLFVLEVDGALLHSQGTAELELGPSYDIEKVRTFLAAWKRGGPGVKDA